MVNNIFNSNSIFDSNTWFPKNLMLLSIPEIPVPLLFANMYNQNFLKNPAESYYKNSKLFGGKVPSKNLNLNLNDFYSKNSDIINSAVSMGSEAIKAFGPERNLNRTTNTLNGIYDGASNVLLSSGNPLGMGIGALMKAGSALTDVTSGLRKAADGMTTVDSILESDFFAISPIGLVNSIFGKNSKTFGANKDNEALLGNYLGHALNRDWASDHSNKRYGFFSSGSRRRDDRKIDKYLKHEDTLSGITKEVQQQNDIANSMYDYASIQRHNKMHGGPGLLQIGKNGLKLDEKILKVKNRKKDFKPKFNPVSINVIFERPNRTLDLLFEYAALKNPRFWQRIFESPKYLDFGNGNLESHLMLYTIDSQGKGYIYPRILEDDSGNLKDYDDMAFKRAILKGDYLEMNDSEINLFLNNYKNINPNFFTPVFLKGGSIIKDSGALVKLEETTQKNVIPDGALHKNKHHMDNAEDLTKKGIPVVDNNGELQAEIEKEELVIILEVTKKLEELKKIFDSEESTQKEKDLVAIEAGKLMVDLIINNTDDKVNLLKKLQNEIE